MDFSAFTILSKHSNRRACTIYSIVASSAHFCGGEVGECIMWTRIYRYTYFSSAPLLDSCFYTICTCSGRNIMGFCTTTTLIDVNLNGWGLYLHIKDLIYIMFYVQVDYREVGRRKGRTQLNRAMYSYALRYIYAHGDTRTSVYMSINTLKNMTFSIQVRHFVVVVSCWYVQRPCHVMCAMHIYNIVYINADMHYSMCDNRAIFRVSADKLEQGTAQNTLLERAHICLLCRQIIPKQLYVTNKT